ncbi:MAG: hypothetical protein KGP14_00880 [Betaproteobacteria bacterium]|nr:hypothetical protein [Betaproteobacteria bacterium]
MTYTSPTPTPDQFEAAIRAQFIESRMAEIRQDAGYEMGQDEAARIALDEWEGV